MSSSSATLRCFGCGEPVERLPGRKELPRCESCRENNRDRNRRLLAVELQCALFALLAAIVGASIWAAIAFWTGHEIGFVAALLGGIVGLTTRLAARGETYARVAPIATGATILGFVVGKLATLAALFVASGLEPTGQKLYDAVVIALPEALSLYDGVWVVLALIAAWRWSQPSFP